MGERNGKVVRGEEKNIVVTSRRGEEERKGKRERKDDRRKGREGDWGD